MDVLGHFSFPSKSRAPVNTPPATPWMHFEDDMLWKTGFLVTVK